MIFNSSCSIKALQSQCYTYLANIWKHFLFFKFTDELLAIKRGIFIEKINRVNLDFMLSSQRHLEELWKHSLPSKMNTMPLPTCKLVIGSAILSSLSCLITMDKMQRKWKNIKQQLRDGSDIPPLRAKRLLRVETVKCFHTERTTQGAGRKASSGKDL